MSPTDAIEASDSEEGGHTPPTPRRQVNAKKSTAHQRFNFRSNHRHAARDELTPIRSNDGIVTAGGCELITRGVPVVADEIEALMRG